MQVRYFILPLQTPITVSCRNVFTKTMLSFFRVKHSLLTVAFIICLHIVAFAQLKADFTLDKAGGCSPLAVSFTNTSTGISSTATYEWNFGNGNSSSLKNPGAVFREEKQYNVTLTIKDGNQISTETQTVTVYKKPSVDFISSSQKGCAPFPVTFTSTSTPGDGTIADYFWDFGDGTAQSTSNNLIEHTYAIEQNPAVSLTVTNNFGCQSTLVKEKVISVLPKLLSSFGADETILCNISDAARFINNSTGPGTLSYIWDFGDGATSTDKQPSHVFNVANTYTIKLRVTSSEGCVANSTKNEFINAANFNSQIELPLLLCSGNDIQFIGKSKTTPDNSFWEFGDGYTQNYPGGRPINYGYQTAGSYTVKLTNQFGACKNVITKTIDVKQSPVLKGYLLDITSPCGSPVKVNFKDTTQDAVAWEWAYRNWPADFTSNLQAPSYTFPFDGSFYVNLKVTNAIGCSSSINKELNLRKPYVTISTPDESPGGQVRICESGTARFFANTQEQITGYVWDFGDGSTSTDQVGIHLYNKEGEYKVKLIYTTAKGCTNTADYWTNVIVRNKVKADFSVSQKEICGNTPVTMTNSSTIDYFHSYHWNFGDDSYWDGSYEYRYSVTHQFRNEGLYTISLIVTDLVCADTMTKTAYIKVSPPFPKISGFTNTCEGTRGEVTFTQSSRQAESWTWDFGDGTSPLTLTANQTEVKHNYTKTGTYKVVLSNTNGQCTVRDSIYVSVLLKQYPVLSADKTEVCSRQDFLKLSISNLEKNPTSPENYSWGYGFMPYHSDSTYALTYGNNSEVTNGKIVLTKWDFIPGKEGLWAVVYSGHFFCYDTTNLIPLKIKGPIAGFKVNPKSCIEGTKVFFEDTSKLYNNIAIKSWEWGFGDGTSQTYTSPGEISHTYSWPNQYYATLKVTDVSGCTSVYGNWVFAESSSLKASFTSSSTTISPGSTVNFTNTSQTSDNANTIYKWILGDGTELTSVNASKTFSEPGTYTITLSATNTAKGCKDIASATIVVKYVNAAFSFNTSFISNSKCPPVLVRFTNLSNNVNKITWNFGDGTVVHDVFNPTHVYTKTGFYKITVTTYSDNGTSYITEDSIDIKQPTVNVTADILRSCTAQSVTVSAINENASSYVWDFGDGTIGQATDTFSTHYYSKAGNYTPQLIAKDANGCAASVTLNDKIIIDSLSLSLNNLPQKICSPKEIVLNPTIVNIAADQAQQNLIYHWDFGTGAAKDTSDIETPSFTYQQPGTYNVSLKVESAFGCVKESKTTIVAYQGLGGQINGPSEICEDATVQFTGATQLQGQPQWKWIFDDGSIVTQQNPPAKAYKDAGSFIVKLLVDNNGCTDTISKSLLVHVKPIVSLSSKQAMVCEGSDVSIIAGGGISYVWTPANGLNSINSAAIIAAPVANTTYTVSVTDSYGCINTDSAKIVVAHPFKMSLTSEAVVCKGKTIELKSSGAATYQWIGNTISLNNTAIANPLVTPAQTAIYTVVGADKDNCFTDTASIQVLVKPAPTVDAGQSVEILMGSPHQLQPTASSDVQSWSWSPAKYLSCTTCQSPEAKPVEPMNYQVTVTNGFGCTATDTVSIKLFCSESRIYIPNSFTPNNDGVNDRFSIKGQGIRIVKYLGIYNRWGELVFERSNFQVDDKNGTWDGRFKGLLAPTGSYVYFAEMSCNEKTFTQKGTVTVVY
jgi:gliding motility-associated-like protein